MRQEMGFDMVVRHTHESFAKRLTRKIFNIPGPQIIDVEDTSDTVFWLFDEEHDMLINHRQYKAFVANAASECGIIVTLELQKPHHYKIKFTRLAEKAAA
jgi:hypothetical protein